VSGTAAAGEARVRVLHASPDAPAVDVYADGSKVLTDVPFGVISDYLTVPAGPHHLQVYATGTTSGAVIDADVTLAAGKAYTVAATDALSKIEAQVIVDDPVPAAGKAQVRAVHLSADAPAVDVAPRGSAAGAALVKGLVYPKNTGYLDLSPASYQLDVRPAGTTTVAVAPSERVVSTRSADHTGPAARQPPGSAHRHHSWIPRTKSRTAEARRSRSRPGSPIDWSAASPKSAARIRTAASRGSISGRTRPRRCSAAR